MLSVIRLVYIVWHHITKFLLELTEKKIYIPKSRQQNNQLLPVTGIYMKSVVVLWLYDITIKTHFTW